MASSAIRQTLFERDNARTQTLDEVVSTFVPPDSFWRLLSAKHHVLFGSRGSGKTAVLKMLSHDHLSRFEDRETKKLIRNKAVVGLYVPMRAEWVGTLKNKPWQNEAQGESWFQWRLNISTCSAFIDTMQSCVRCYVEDEAEQLITERQISLALSVSWLNGQKAQTFNSLRAHLEDIEWARQIYAVDNENEFDESVIRPGKQFDVELFAPLRRAITILKRAIQFPAATMWIVCLDELEFLDESHHRILNTYMRSSSESLFFKMATMPYFHHTLKTNTRARLVHGDDFQYVYLDFDPAFRGTDRHSWLTWAEQVVGKKLSYMNINAKDFTFADTFGPRTPLLDEKDQDWTINSPMMALLRRYGTPETFNRAQRLAGSPAFRDQISRKMHGSLLLREAAATAGGNKEHELYGGPAMVVRCSDANARQLIRIFNMLTYRNPKPDSATSRVPIYRPSLREQTRMMIDYSREGLERVACEEEVGERLAKFVEQLGWYFHHRFYDQPLTTDHFFAIEVKAGVDNETWSLIKYAVGLGLLFPKGRPGSKKVDILPANGGVFNLAYRLAPCFGLLPRRGRPVLLSTILRTPIRTERHTSDESSQYALLVGETHP